MSLQLANVIVIDRNFRESEFRESVLSTHCTWSVNIIEQVVKVPVSKVSLESLLSQKY